MMNSAILILALNINGHFVLRRSFSFLHIDIATFDYRIIRPYMILVLSCIFIIQAQCYFSGILSICQINLFVIFKLIYTNLKTTMTSFIYYFTSKKTGSPTCNPPIAIRSLIIAKRIMIRRLILPVLRREIIAIWKFTTIFYL